MISTRTVTSLLAATILANGSLGLQAQTGGFIATLGNDTVHAEQFTAQAGVYRGTVVTRVPITRVIRYSLAVSPTGGLASYTFDTFDGDGSAVRTNGAAGSLRVVGDSVIRVLMQDGRMDTTRIAAPHGVIPAPSIPYVGVTYLSYEIGFAAMRAASDSMLYQLPAIAQMKKPTATHAWLIGSDSAELNYFGVARSGYKFDEAGRLLRADWRATTYRYRIVRTGALDVETMAKVWSSADKRGAAFGALSPRDTARFVVGGADITIDYSRPSKRGRRVWGEVVPWGTVWRLGADVATHFSTSRDLIIGGTEVPAGTYTLWMLPSESGESKLIINTRTRIFGTMYNSAADFARIALAREPAAQTEMLSLSVQNGALRIQWDNVAWLAGIAVK